MIICAGCGKTISTENISTKVISYKNNSYTVPNNPTRVITLSNSLLQMVYAVNGTAIARTHLPYPLPEKMEKLPSVGHSSHINTEKLLSLKPDLVLGLATQHKKLAGMLESNNIPYIHLAFNGINDNVPLLRFFGELYNTQNTAEKVISNYNNKIKIVKNSIKDINPARVAVLFATSKSVTAETNIAITASMVQELGMDDVVSHHITGNDINSMSIPYSMETLAQDNPEILFIVSMGKQDKIEKQMNKSMKSHPAWRELNAVKNNKVFFLSSDKFLLNPGINTPEAMAELVNKAYGIKPNI